MGLLARLLFLLLAVTAYAANGAQTHLRVDDGKVVEVPLCGLGGDRTVTLHLGSKDTPEKTGDTCCGACMMAHALPADPPRLLAGPVDHPGLPDPAPAPAVHPRSPLWPGAPPQGPPALRKA
jgi:hypothetical protein